MQDIRCESVLCALDRSLALFDQLRTPDPVSVAAYDTLKQARALIARALTGEVRTEPAHSSSAMRIAAPGRDGFATVSLSPAARYACS